MLTFHTSAPLCKSSDVCIDTALSYELVTSQVPEEYGNAHCTHKEGNSRQFGNRGSANVRSL